MLQCMCLLRISYFLKSIFSNSLLNYRCHPSFWWFGNRKKYGSYDTEESSKICAESIAFANYKNTQLQITTNHFSFKYDQQQQFIKRIQHVCLCHFWLQAVFTMLVYKLFLLQNTKSRKVIWKALSHLHISISRNNC